MDLLGLVIGLQSESAGLPIAVLRGAQLYSDFSDWFSASRRWFLGDINNDVSSLYVEIIDKNRSYYKCTIYGRKMSRKQRLETHLNCVHGKGEK